MQVAHRLIKELPRLLVHIQLHGLRACFLLHRINLFKNRARYRSQDHQSDQKFQQGITPGGAIGRCHAARSIGNTLHGQKFPLNWRSVEGSVNWVAAAPFATTGFALTVTNWVAGVGPSSIRQRTS